MDDQLLAGIVEDPSDETRWAVLIDWLIARGDARGELAGASDPDAALRSLAPAWFGAEVRVAGGRVVVGGDPDDPVARGSSVAMAFERGHVRQLRVNVVNDALDPDEHGPRWGADWIPALVRRALTQPVGRLVQTVEIRQGPDWTGELRCDALLDAVLAGAPLAARTLAWGCDHDWEFVELPDCAPLLEAAPWLESLTLQGEGGLPRRLRHPRLRRLGLGALQPGALEPFAAAELPALEHLTVWLEFDDTAEVDSAFAPERLAPLLAATLPSLRSLSLPRCPEADTVVAALTRARWFAQLEALTVDGVERR